MILTAAFVSITVAALWRRPDWIAGSLLAALLLATVLGWAVPLERTIGISALLDALVSIAMLIVWTYYRSQRARLVGSIAAAKCAWCFLMASSTGMDWFTFATVQNGGFLVQVLIAGGWADGLVAFIDRIDPGAIRQRRSRRENVG